MSARECRLTLPSRGQLPACGLQLPLMSNVRRHMSTPSRIALALFAVAIACYLAGWTVAGAGLGLLGVLSELVAWLSMSADN
jgi:hypothetical protein